jgi:hypothetical protein
VKSPRSRRRLSIALALATTLLAGSVWAQQPEDEARAHFTAGVNLLRDPSRPRYEEAYAEFKQAYALTPAPTILGNMALCAFKLERDQEAIDLYTKFLAESPSLDPTEKEQIERDLSTLKVGIARVTVTSNPAGAVVQDVRIPSTGESITNIYGPIDATQELGIRRGHHVMKARWPGGAEAVWELDVNGGEAHVFDKPVESENPAAAPQTSAPLAPRPQAAPERPVPKGVTITGLATVALGAGALVTGIVAVNTRSRFDRANDGTDPVEADDLRSSGKTLNVVSDVLLVGTIIGAVATVYLYVTRPPASARPTSDTVGPTKVGTQTTRGVSFVPGTLSGTF